MVQTTTGLQAETRESAREMADSLRQRSHTHRAAAEWDKALRCAKESARIATVGNLPELVHEALNAEALVYHVQGKFPEAISRYEKLLAAKPNAKVKGQVLQNLGTINAIQGQFTAARLLFSASVKSFQAADWPRGTMLSLINLGGVIQDAGDPEDALTYFEHAIKMASEGKDQEMAALARLNRAEALWRLHRCREALDDAARAFGHYQVTDDIPRRIACMQVLGDIYLSMGRGDSSRNIWKSAHILATELGLRVEADLLSQRLSTLRAFA